jgi:superfamily I DNA/RNA helicase
MDGEADFIVMHPEHGFLFLEVKGGRVAYDAATSMWSSTDRNDITSDIKDPVNQALVCKHRYIDRLRKLEGWPPGHIRFRHGVILPDCERPSRGTLTIAGYEKFLFCFADGFDGDFPAWIVERLAAHEAEVPGRERPPSTIGIQLMMKLAADPVNLRVPMRRLVESDLAAFEQLLTGQQLHALTVLEALPRVLVEGGAGTGKTVLAAEMAARIRDQGEAVCLMCYNEPLAAHLKRTIGSSEPGLLVGTFHEVCGLLVHWAGGQLGPRGPRFFEDDLPALAERALVELRFSHPKWHAVIVDEAQDFRDHWWPVVTGMVRDPEAGLLRVFLDTNQALYATPQGLAERLRAKEILLRYNLRNTKAIARASEPLYEGPAILPVGPEGEKPVATVMNYADAQVQAVQQTYELIKAESVNPQDIVILCPNELGAKRVREELSRIRVAVTNASTRSDRAVTVDTIRRFKGLEGAVVIVVVDRVAADSRELAYVSVTRAQSRLMVFGELRGTSLGTALGIS